MFGGDVVGGLECVDFDFVVFVVIVVIGGGGLYYVKFYYYRYDDDIVVVLFGFCCYYIWLWYLGCVIGVLWDLVCGVVIIVGVGSWVGECCGVIWGNVDWDVVCGCSIDYGWILY